MQLREGWLQLYWSPDELQDDRQRALALPGLLQLDPGEGRGQRHRHARRGPATHAAWTRGTFTIQNLCFDIIKSIKYGIIPDYLPAQAWTKVL